MWHRKLTNRKKWISKHRKKLHEKTDQTQKLSISFSIPQQNKFLCNVHARRRSVDEELWIFG